MGFDTIQRISETSKSDYPMNRDHTIDYIELPAADFNAAKMFYKKVFHWTFTDYGDGYTAFTDGRLDGGFYKSEQSSRTTAGAALVVFYVRDLEATRQQIVDAGGTIVKDIFSFPGGRRFHFTDPNGNELAVWSAGEG